MPRLYSRAGEHFNVSESLLFVAKARALTAQKDSCAYSRSSAKQCAWVWNPHFIEQPMRAVLMWCGLFSAS